MSMTLTMCCLTYLEALKDAPIGKNGNFRRGADMRTRVWNNTVELTSRVIEIERAKLETVPDNAKDSGKIKTKAGFEQQGSDR